MRRPDWSRPHWPSHLPKDRCHALLQRQIVLKPEGRRSKANYRDIKSGEHYWISGPSKGWSECLYATNIPAEIDEDLQREYWMEIRECPERVSHTHS